MRRYIFLLTAIALLLAQTLPTIIGGRFTFAFDMGRDLVWVRNMVELKKPTLIGPWGSIAGVYFGPLWYYLLSAPYVIFNGDPRAAAAVPLAANLLAIIIGWIFLRRRKHPAAAGIFALLYSVSPLVVSLSGFAFHANLLPLVTLLFLIGDLPLAALSASIAYHLEPAAGVMLTIFLIVYKGPALLKTRPGLIRTIAISAILFLTPFIPQIIFELRHSFVQTNSLISYFRGENTSLGGVLPLNQRITERVTKIAGTLSYSVFPVSTIWQQWLMLVVFLLLIAITARKYRSNQFIHTLLLTSYSLLLFHYLAYALLFPAELKSWYLSGFASIFILTASVIIEKIFTRRRLIGISIVAILVFWNTETFTKLIPKNTSPAAAETLTAQLEVVDWIYQDALKSAEPFSIYTYTPPIYDYTYQYLFWWRGTKKYDSLPAEYSYLPGESNYLPEKHRFISLNRKPGDAKFVYLVVEPDSVASRQQGWLGHFASLTSIDKTEFSSGLIVEKRYKL